MNYKGSGKVHFGVDDVSLYGTPKEEPGPGLPGQEVKQSFLKNQLQALFQPTDNKLAMKLFGSKKALMKERIRQKAAGHWVIHPCSSFRWVLPPDIKPFHLDRQPDIDPVSIFQLEMVSSHTDAVPCPRLKECMIFYKKHTVWWYILVREVDYAAFVVSFDEGFYLQKIFLMTSFFSHVVSGILH